MPTFYGAGVTVSLSTADLFSTLRTRAAPDLSAAEAAAEQSRWQHTSLLLDRLLPDDGNYSVLRFLDGDMPFMMAEAGESISEHIFGHAARSSPGRASPSSLSSLSGPMNYSPDEASSPETPIANLRLPPQLPQSLNTFSPSNFSHHQATEPKFQTEKALILAVELTERTHRKDVDKVVGRRSRLSKTEVFMNGRLVATLSYNPLKKSRRISQLFTGTRFHEASERPWVYRTESEGYAQASDIWACTKSLIQREAIAKASGCFSARYLHALAEVELPGHLANKNGLGIMDVFVTIGHGLKQGSFLSGPDRMPPDPSDGTSAAEPGHLPGDLMTLDAQSIPSTSKSMIATHRLEPVLAHECSPSNHLARVDAVPCEMDSLMPIPSGTQSLTPCNDSVIGLDSDIKVTTGQSQVAQRRSSRLAGEVLSSPNDAKEMEKKVKKEHPPVVLKLGKKQQPPLQAEEVAKPDRPTIPSAEAPGQLLPSSKESIIGHADESMQRQIGKSRAGVFTEEEFIVGFRMLVV